MKIEGFLKKFVTVFPLIFVGFLTVLFFVRPWRYHQLVMYEGVIEGCQAFLYFASAIIVFAIALSLRKDGMRRHSMIFFLLAAACLFVSLEEVSYGQHIFDFESPEFLKKINKQDETTIHNIKYIHEFFGYLFIVVGFYGFGLRYILSERIKRAYSTLLELYVPPKYLALYFIPVTVMYTYFQITILLWADYNPPFAQEQEVAEFFMVLGFFLMFTATLIKSRTRRNYWKRLFKEES